ncbi:hypothetical protein [Lentzea aerocolonigenes]|uniref:hypothetical protein n=1 Tax=Lentzea aerocolonigenes TaxID=68170 RepID=UPI0012E115E3|nr:hypothetical protein [Lentzea aerocolonigenes]
MKKILGTAAAVAIAATALVMPGTASAANCDPDKHVRINVQKRGNFVDAVGGFFNCDQATTSFTIAVQEKKTIGWKDHVVRTGVFRTNVGAITTYTCNGTKTKKYRALFITGIGTHETVKTSASITVACG